MKKYTVKDFLAGKVSIRCGNDEQKKAVMKVCKENGIVWLDGESVNENYFIPFDPVLTINFFGDGRLSCGNGDHRGMNVVNFDEIDLSPAPCYQITIECDGDITTAKMRINGKEVKTATAKRNPADKANWRVGAQTAFDRLWKQQEKPEEKKDGVFKVGDRVVCIDDKLHPGVFVCGKHGRVVSIDDDSLPIGVEFDEEIYGHDCGGHAKRHNGWYFRTNELRHEQPTKQKVREVKRKAKVGEYVKLTRPFFPTFMKTGDVVRVSSTPWDDNWALVRERDLARPSGKHTDPDYQWNIGDDYVVLEGYKP